MSGPLFRNVPGRIVRCSKIFGLASILILAGGSVAPAMAEAPSTEIAKDSLKLQNAELLNLWGALDVPTQTQQRLASKMQRGIIPDAGKEMATPVHIEHRSVKGFNETIERYADGSVAFAFVQTPDAHPNDIPAEVSATINLNQPVGPSVGARADKTYITSCTGGASGSGYAVWRDCLVQGTRPAISLSFRATYTLVNGAYDSITEINTPRVTSTGGGASTPTLSTTKKFENSSGPAQATARTVHSKFLGGNDTHTLVLNVGNNSAYANWK